MLKELMACKHTDSSRFLNYLLIPTTVFNIDPEGAKKFNKIYLWLKKQNLRKLERTPSGAISKTKDKVRRPCWDVRRIRSCLEITVIMESYAWRIQFRTKTPKGLSGRAAFTKFKRLLLKDGVDLDLYAIENGAEVKTQIERPLIGACHKVYYDRIFENANHIDFHSSYAAGLANTHPEFRKTLETIFKNREKDDINKCILNFSIGFFQSIAGCGAKWSHLSRDAIKDNNSRIRELAKRLDAAGRTVIAFNTDGIWYNGKTYHGQGEGSGLGQWHNDHTNCRFRMKSAGAYEFIEDGVYNPVVRGIANDTKTDWQWGDIYSEKAELQLFTFSEDEGVKLNGKEI